MLDIKLIRENPDSIKQALEKRNCNVSFDELLAWDKERKTLLLELETIRQERNKQAQENAKIRAQGGEVLSAAKGVADTKEKESALGALDKKIEDFLLTLPNLADESVPIGKDEQQNKVVKEIGVKPEFSFKSKQHWELGEKLGIIDFAAASNLSGARFVLLKGAGCQLERALISFMLDLHTSRGYKEIMPPYLVSSETMKGTGQLPKFAEDLFKCAEDDLYLIPTAEVPLTNMHRDEIIEEKALPLKYVAYTACFRREAGSYGKDTKGLIRQHQFNKIELVKFALPQNSTAELESMVEDASEVLKQLGIAHRVVALSSGDMGFSASKTYDLEVWMSGEQRWREISSCSNCKDFQARRMNTKVKTGKDKVLVHTLNGSGVAVGRLFAAILENYQQQDGSIVVPEKLRSYMKLDVIK
jgi:seryl-tRNA synthetase